MHHQFTRIPSAESSVLNRIIFAKNSGKLEKKSASTIPSSVSSIISDNRVDSYDSQIDKFIEDKYNSEEMIEKYLINREVFIQDVCREIERNMQEENQGREREEKAPKYEGHLPKIEECLPHSPQRSKLQMYWRNNSVSYLLNSVQTRKQIQKKA